MNNWKIHLENISPKRVKLLGLTERFRKICALVGLANIFQLQNHAQGYFQAPFYYRYTVVKTLFSIEFSSSIFFHNLFTIY